MSRLWTEKELTDLRAHVGFYLIREGVVPARPYQRAEAFIALRSWARHRLLEVQSWR